jgi:hypothetical protein
MHFNKSKQAVRFSAKPPVMIRHRAGVCTGPFFV